MQGRNGFLACLLRTSWRIPLTASLQVNEDHYSDAVCGHRGKLAPFIFNRVMNEEQQALQANCHHNPQYCLVSLVYNADDWVVYGQLPERRFKQNDR